MFIGCSGSFIDHRQGLASGSQSRSSIERLAFGTASVRQQSVQW
jgi:hypothetical protein